MSTQRDEYLESLWRLKEQDKESLEDLETMLDIPFESEVIEGLVSDGLVTLDRRRRAVGLTDEGRTYARGLVRKHRLAERLLHDVLRIRTESVEAEACTFEHLVAPQVVQGICTLLGHPRECPHGLPIPEGECCRHSEVMVAASVMPLSDLAVGETGQVAYVNCQDDAQLHRLNGLQLKPGAAITLHQKYPACVVECEGGMIALDQRIADSVCVWKEAGDRRAGVRGDEGKPTGRGKSRRFWQRRQG